MKQELTRITELADDLAQLLERLRFRDIRIRLHSDCHDPAETLSGNSGDYNVPAVVAFKNEVEYYFEFVTEEMLDNEKSYEPIRAVQNSVKDCEEKELILITEYGNKDRAQKWCTGNGHKVQDIWEL